MKARWLALLIPVALTLGFAQDAAAGGYGNKHGHYGQSYSHGYKHGGYRKHGYRAPAYRSHKYGYRGSHRGYRHGYRKDYRHGYRAAYPAYRHGYRDGRRYGHSRSYRSPAPYFYGGGITLHFGY